MLKFTVSLPCAGTRALGNDISELRPQSVWPKSMCSVFMSLKQISGGFIEKDVDKCKVLAKE